MIDKKGFVQPESKKQEILNKCIESSTDKAEKPKHQYVLFPRACGKGLMMAKAIKKAFEDGKLY